ncbi:DNA helicase HerA-like ATPase [Stackebrandtia endophytica]|uniref:DNA helicase HerA-like ATPase n=1 Tax=Stackebrandtia endophytica TaxID=1496996 RepID=A0A543B3D8_9ACTN|nr:ATP-binding protein [Stackebrandtia endophytica]TQL79351.1 DNA helicase HerA-like ATPase [Stackebrandtia endophytica]
MKARELEALSALRFDAVPTEQTLWGGQLPHVPELNQSVYDRVREEIGALNKPAVDSPVGMVVHGEYGSGKSHLVWWARRFIAGIGGYYFNIQPDGSAQTLWSRVVDSILRDLHEPLAVHQMPPDPTTQLSLVVERLAGLMKLPEESRSVLCGRRAVEPAEARIHLKAFTDGIRTFHPNQDLRNVALALGLLALRDDEAPIAGWAFLKNQPEELELRKEWGLRLRPAPPVDMVRHLSTLLAMTGPSLFVVDQIDDMVTTSAQLTQDAGVDQGSTDLAAALMTIREKLTRSITLISCLDHTWQTIRKRSVRSALDRFRDGLYLEPIPNARIARDLMVNLLAPQYDEIGFAAPYPTWPVPTEAFDRAVGIRPRQLIQRFDQYVKACRAAGDLLPSPDLGATTGAEAPVRDDATQRRFVDHRRAIVLSGLKETRAEKDLGEVLAAAARALAVEVGLTDELTVREVGRGAENASVHCEVTGAVETLFVRGINTVKASAVGSRVDKALAVAYSDPEQASHLFIARTDLWGETPRIQKAVAAIIDAGGTVIDVVDDELRTLRAVQLTATGGSDEVMAWLREHRPVSATAFGKSLLQRITPGAPRSTGAIDTCEVEPQSSEHDAVSTAVEPDDPQAIPLGRTIEDKTIELDLHALRKHVAMFASSGSGKTVLLRRIIEECALRGVSTIVLDPNNDLARLGDAWPAAPVGWGVGDDDRARDYLESTDVVVWTPGVSKGNPLTLQALPDFSAVRDDPDELRLAVDTAVASLAPRARIDGESHTADGRRAILRETLMVFARDGGRSLDQLIEMLLDPVDEVLALPSAKKHADFVASALSYARTNDPLFGGEGTGFDPDRLLTPADGYRARVSVINLAGIPEENRPAFVNRLQMTLFSWIKRHPAKDKPLSGLFVMDEAQTFIPSGKNTPCTESTRNLASQARKYGLGLVYATQAPRGIDSRITGNAASHVYGRVTVPAHVGAVQEMARSRGEEAPLVSKLTAGRFFVSLEGAPLTETMVPMCLSHHGSPLEEAEIAERARGKR